ncbi:PREDICTED: UDP-glucuronosyltransferase 2C1-like isoform X1 [Rhagoletis zephyria]|uniref:UDP-glucuronosyltransferase 2C1-like isoform X1 n=1 Tax=Rhagoletis zephyria TaxID=28612 RepID=UPI000811973A|nr:PREDICTED: UDP-glucuronosyltransferase 2C1-like isoform X1 [Rhagoletis zephyria]
MSPPASQRMTSSSLLCYLILLALAVSRFNSVSSARILGFFPSPVKSHLIVHAALAETLAQAGHDVTVIASVRNVYPHAKYEYIEIDGAAFDPSVLTGMVNNSKPFYRKFDDMMKAISISTNASITHARMQRFLSAHGAGAFDLLLLGYFMNDFHLGLAAHFQCPLIVSFMIQPILSVNLLLANPAETAYVPTMLSNLAQPLDFLGRVKNYLFALLEEFSMVRFIRRLQQELYDYNFPPDRYPPLDEVRKNVSLVFVNHHFSQGPIRPNVPNLIEIGGIQIKEKPDPLPADIAKVLDETKDGVIYFSLGTNIQGSHLTEEKTKIMFKVISKLPYKVLWKWGESVRPGQSKNIIYKEWLPQDDILAHPNVKLFITHGGMGSVVEAQYHGVPIVGIPLFGDQPSNMANVERSGFGLSVDYTTLSEESLNNAIQEVLNNPKYTKAVRDFSRLYRDRPMTPRQTVVYWVEYVLRHHGAKHMQSPAVYLNRWQLMSLDVIAFLLVIVGSVVAVFVKICRLLCCRGRKSETIKGTPTAKVKKTQ